MNIRFTKTRFTLLTVALCTLLTYIAVPSAQAASDGNYYLGTSVNPIHRCTNVTSAPPSFSAAANMGQSYTLHTSGGVQTSVPMTGSSGEYQASTLENSYLSEVAYTDLDGTVAYTLPDGGPDLAGDGDHDPYSTYARPIYWHITNTGLIDYFADGQGHVWGADTVKVSGNLGYVSPIKVSRHPTMWAYFNFGGESINAVWACGKSMF